MERKFSSSSLKTLKLVTGRQLHTYAKNAMANYRKALAYSKHVWNMDTMEKKDSGNTLDDILLYVWTKMYKEEMRKKTRIEILQHKKKKKMLRSSKILLLILMK